MNEDDNRSTFNEGFSVISGYFKIHIKYIFYS